MTAHNHHHLPTLRQLFKATAIAALAASVILVTTVLPSEYGIDPTGIGKAMGLTRLKTDAEAAKIPVAAATPQASAVQSEVQSELVVKSTAPLRKDETSLTLQSGQGAEVKATMRSGERLVYSWSTEGGVVNVDMHGEKPNAGEEFTSYWKGKQVKGDQGTFVAPFDGTHGWFWRNRGNAPVTVKVAASGFYSDFARVK